VKAILNFQDGQQEEELEYTIAIEELQRGEEAGFIERRGVPPRDPQATAAAEAAARAQLGM